MNQLSKRVKATPEEHRPGVVRPTGPNEFGGQLTEIASRNTQTPQQSTIRADHF